MFRVDSGAAAIYLFNPVPRDSTARKTQEASLEQICHAPKKERECRHIAQQCTRLKLTTNQRRCHTCNKPGHLSRQCPDKDKAARANVGAQSQAAPVASAAQERVAFFRVIEDDSNGVPPAPGAQRRATTIGDLPVQKPRTTQRERRDETQHAIPAVSLLGPFERIPAQCAWPRLLDH